MTKTLCPVCGLEEVITEPIDGVNHSNCLNCGFITHQNLIFNTLEQNIKEQNMPALIKELMVLDATKHCWYPAIILTDMGALYPDGKSVDDWSWKVAKPVTLSKEERKNHPIPGKEGEYYETKLDIFNAKKVNSYKEGIELLVNLHK